MTYVEGTIRGKFRCKAELQANEKRSKGIKAW